MSQVLCKNCNEPIEEVTCYFASSDDAQVAWKHKLAGGNHLFFCGHMPGKVAQPPNDTYSFNLDESQMKELKLLLGLGQSQVNPSWIIEKFSKFAEFVNSIAPNTGVVKSTEKRRIKT